MPKLDGTTVDRFTAFCDLVELATGHALEGDTDSVTGRCPSHDDRSASLSVRRDRKLPGGFWFKCFAGCSPDDIASSLGEDLATLKFGDISQGVERTITEQIVVDDDEEEPVEVRRYDYRNEAGKVIYQVVRYEPKTFKITKPHPQGKILKPGKDRTLYRLPELLEGIRKGRTVYFVEGEKDADNLAARGHIATCVAGGAEARWQEDWNEYFTDADLVVICDNDKVGRKFGRMVANQVVNLCKTVRLSLPAVTKPKADVSDHLEAGFTVKDLILLPERLVRRTEWDLVDLLEAEFEPPTWAIPGIIPAGLSLLVGAPKMGKSWFNLSIMSAVTTGRGGEIFGWGQNTDPADCLYIALEDPAHRVQLRTLQLLEEIPPPARGRATTWLSCPDLEHGGKERIEAWLDRHPEASCVLVDVLAKIKGPNKGEDASYDRDYSTMAILKDIADDYGVSVIVTHHDRKSGDPDILNMVSGTKGVTGAADTVLYLIRARGGDEGKLFVESRDVESTTYGVRFSESGRWMIIEEDVDAPDTSGNHSKKGGGIFETVKAVLTAQGSMHTHELCEVVDAKATSVTQALSRGRRDGVFDKDETGAWYVL